MTNAYRDENDVPTLIGVSSDDGYTPVRVKVDPTTGRMLVDNADNTPPGGSNTQVQFNDSDAFGGDSGLTYIKTGTGQLTIGDTDTSGTNGLVLSGGKYIHFNDDPTNNYTEIGVSATAVTNGDGTELDIYAGSGNGSGAGGGVYIQGGYGGAGGGGEVGVWGGSATNGSGDGGSVSLYGGNGDGGGNAGGDVILKGGAGNNGASIGYVTVQNKSNNLVAKLDVASISSTSKTFTFPNSTGTFALSNVAQTFTGAQTFSNAVNYTNNAIAASGNAATVPITAKLNTVTNNSAATLTITMATASAVDGQMTIVRILDASAAAQTITWVNTENSTVSAPTTSNGSTTLFLTVGFIYNGATSKWRCIASA